MRVVQHGHAEFGLEGSANVCCCFRDLVRRGPCACLLASTPCCSQLIWAGVVEGANVAHLLTTCSSLLLAHADTLR